MLEFPRSTVYAKRQRESGKVAPWFPQKRGPKPMVSDVDLLAAIRTDLNASPFVGEGHRKVWARLRLAGLRVAKKRVLRLMRENGLLSPHRTPKETLNKLLRGRSAALRGVGSGRSLTLA